MPRRGRRRHDWSWERSEPKAATHFPSLREDGGMVSSMFIRDVPLNVVPLSVSRSKNKEFKVSLSGNAANRRRVIALLRSFGSRDRFHLKELAMGAIGDIAQDISWCGRAPYEIGRAKEDQSIYLLSRFTPKRLFNLFWRWVQLVPKQDQDLWKRRVTFLSRRAVWVVGMPKSLGGYRGYRTILRKLERFGHTGPSFWQDDLGRGRPPSTYFNFQEYRREVEIFESRVTRKWGWNRRDFSGSNWTEFTQLYRTLTFYWAKAAIREHIVSEFNSLLARLDIRAEIAISGMPTSIEILRLRGEMAEGKITFGEALETASV
jgi:hypothetical protein